MIYMTGEITEEDRLLLIKLNIQKKVERHTRMQARYFMMVFAVVVMLGGTVVAPPTDVITMIMILILCFGVIPVATVILEYSIIKYRTKIQLQKYLEGEDVNEW